MIRHSPFGSGHPYSVDTDQRDPVDPVAGEPLTLGVRTSAEVDAVVLEWDDGGAVHEHPLARTEFLFPFTSVVEVAPERLVSDMGPSLVVTAITKDAQLIDELKRSDHVDRLNLGPVPTSHVEWDQPHEGNLFEFLYERRAIQRAVDW